MAPGGEPQAFRMVIEMIITISRRPGVYLGGEISSGVVQIGDRLELMEDGTLIGEVTRDGFGSIDRIAGTERCLLAVHCHALSREEAREGQVLAG